MNFLMVPRAIMFNHLRMTAEVLVSVVVNSFLWETFDMSV